MLSGHDIGFCDHRLFVLVLPPAGLPTVLLKLLPALEVELFFPASIQLLLTKDTVRVSEVSSTLTKLLLIGLCLERFCQCLGSCAIGSLCCGCGHLCPMSGARCGAVAVVIGMRARYLCYVVDYIDVVVDCLMRRHGLSALISG